jgi:hypothetical protein
MSLKKATHDLTQIATLHLTALFGKDTQKPT